MRPFSRSSAAGGHSRPEPASAGAAVAPRSAQDARVEALRGLHCPGVARLEAHTHVLEVFGPSQLRRDLAQVRGRELAGDSDAAVRRAPAPRASPRSELRRAPLVAIEEIDQAGTSASRLAASRATARSTAGSGPKSCTSIGSGEPCRSPSMSASTWMNSTRSPGAAPASARAARP